MGTSKAVSDVRLWQLAIFPVVWSIVLVLLVVVLPTSAQPALFRVGQECVKVLALSGCLFAAAGFEKGDYLRGAWLFNAACFSFLLVRDCTFLPGLNELTNIDLVRPAFAGTANFFGVLSAWRFGRAWSVAELPDTGRNRFRTYVTMGVLALFIAAGSLVVHVRDAMAGNRAALVFIASGVGDIVSLCMIAPVLPTAIALRGGSLAWPWALMAVGFLGWLGYDCADAIMSMVTVDPGIKRTLLEVCRTYGCLYVLSSGIAQRRVASLSG
ncbi:hypothetical protein LZC95_24045 [Pendulispora brunnea]|uniref:YhhN-like protein n=1 Tax=Pendulispora brunnea TaxID=2905690 RepID=A0ABZ2KP89_9BACT